jgi:hypothetical protein
MLIRLIGFLDCLISKSAEKEGSKFLEFLTLRNPK